MAWRSATLPSDALQNFATSPLRFHPLTTSAGFVKHVMTRKSASQSATQRSVFTNEARQLEGRRLVLRSPGHVRGCCHEEGSSSSSCAFCNPESTCYEGVGYGGHASPCPSPYLFHNPFRLCRNGGRGRGHGRDDHGTNRDNRRSGHHGCCTCRDHDGDDDPYIRLESVHGAYR